VHNTKLIIVINKSNSSQLNSNLKAETHLATSEFFDKLSTNYLAPKLQFRSLLPIIVSKHQITHNGQLQSHFSLNHQKSFLGRVGKEWHGQEEKRKGEESSNACNMHQFLQGTYGCNCMLV